MADLGAGRWPGLERPFTGDRSRGEDFFSASNTDTINYQFTIEDPAMFVRPFTAVIPFSRNQGALCATEGQVYEYACHEGNYSIVNVLNGARAQEKAAAENAVKK